MAHQSWTVQLADGNHTVALEHGYWSGKRRIWVDGSLVHESQIRMDPGSTHEVPIGSETGVVRITSNGLTFRYDLVVGGRSVTTGEAADANAPTSPGWITRLNNAGATRNGRPVFTQENLNKELRNSGIVLLIIGVMHLLIPDLWVRLWGLFLCGVGVAGMRIQRPVMVAAHGAAIIGAGVINVFMGGSDTWLLIGGAQVIIGMATAARYVRYADGIARERDEA